MKFLDDFNSRVIRRFNQSQHNSGKLLRRLLARLPAVFIAALWVSSAIAQDSFLLDGSFDNLTVGTAPDRGVPNGAWAFPNDYCCTSGGEAREPSNRKELFGVAETSTFDPTRTGLSLELNDNIKGTAPTVLSNFLVDPIRESDGGIIRVNFNVYVPTSEDKMGGGVIHLSSDPVGYGGLSRWTDVGPSLEWTANNRINAVVCASFTTDCSQSSPKRIPIMKDFPRDTWQHVQWDIDLAADKYDVLWSAGEDSLQEIATDLDFVAGKKRELDRFNYQNRSSSSNDLGHAYVDNVSVTWVSSTPYQAVTLSGAGGKYQQDFDAALGVDSSADDQPLPRGWTGSRNGLVSTDLTTKVFPTTGVSVGTLLYNAGAPQDPDRALAIGIGRETSRGTLQLLADVTDADAQQLQLAFDLEAWDASTTSRNTVDPGEAAFDVSIDIDQGEGFVPLLDLGRVTTGPTLQKPTGAYLDGNDAANRVTFESGLLPAHIPVGSQLRVRWSADPSISQGWVFGLDNVSLSLLGNGAVVLGDFDGNGILDAADIDALTTQSASGLNDIKFDLNNDALVDQADVATWIRDLHHSWIGDVDLNGVFNSGDLINMLSAGTYESDMPSAWSTGDLNGDGRTDSGDLIAALADGGYELGARAAVAAVPEPNSISLLVSAVFCIGWLTRRGKSEF